MLIEGGVIVNKYTSLDFALFCCKAAIAHRKRLEHAFSTNRGARYYI